MWELLQCNSGHEIINKHVASIYLFSVDEKIVLKLSNEHEGLFQLITCVQVLNQESSFKIIIDHVVVHAYQGGWTVFRTLSIWSKSDQQTKSMERLSYNLAKKLEKT